MIYLPIFMSILSLIKASNNIVKAWPKKPILQQREFMPYYDSNPQRNLPYRKKE